MKVFGLLWCGILAAPLFWGVLSRPACGQQTDAATRQYAAAVALQNRAAYKLAADAWAEFIRQFKDDPRLAKAYYYLGICYYQEGQLDAALKSFQAVTAGFPNFEMAPSTQLYLGATQYAMARAGKPELFDAAAGTFQSLLTKYPQSEHRADALYYLGECLYARGRKDEAVRTYRQMLSKYPDHKLAPDAAYALGVAEEESNQPDAAGKTYDAFLARFAQHRLAAEVTMRRGETLLAAGQSAEAGKRFASAAAQPGFALADYATLRQGDVLLQMKRYDEAAALYAALPARFPQSQHAERAAVSAGKCFYLAGKYAEARRLLTPLVDRGGAVVPEAAHWLAQTLLKEKQAEAALTVAEKALPQAGQSAFAAPLLMDRADAVYEIPQRRKEAIALYAAVAAKYPQDPAAPQALYLAGFTALEQGDHAAALGHATAFLSAHVDHRLTPDVLHVAAEANLQLGKFPEADALYRRLVEEFGEHPDAELWKVRRVVSLHAQKKYRETIAAVQPVLKELRQPESVAEAHYLIGSSQAELKEYEAAIRSLTASLAAQPKWRQADETWLVLAHAYRQSGDLEKARAGLGRLIAEFPNSRFLDVARYRLGECLAASGDHAAAAAEYRQVLSKWPASPLAPHALHELGCAQLNRKDAAGAEAAFDSFLEKYPQHALLPRARYARAMARYQLGKHALAVEDLKAVLPAASAAEKSDARFLLGLCQVDLKQHDAAAATFRTLLDEDPKYSAADKARYQLAWALKLVGREADANRVFVELVNGHPESPLVAEAQHNVGEFAYKNKNYAAAARAYYAAVQRADGTPLGEKASHKLGWSYYHLGNHSNAQKTFAYQIKQYPDGPLAADAAFMEAECLFKQGMLAEALAAYERLKPLANKEYQALAFLHAGQAAAQMKDWGKSAQFLGKSTQQFPDAPTAPEAFYELAWAQQNLGKVPEAISLYEQVIAKTDREVAARAQFMIGELHFQAKNHAEAVKSFFKVAYGYSHPKWQADATYEAARCFEVLGQKAQAVKMYQELVEKFPNSDKVPLAKQRLAELKG